MRRWLTVAGVPALLFAVAFLGSPYVAVWRLSQAVKAGDARGVAALTDFPAVRADLKPQLGAYLRGRAGRNGGTRHGWLQSLESRLDPTLLDGAVDLLVTPETLTALLRAGRGPGLAKADPPPDSGPAPDPRRTGDTRLARVGYDGPGLGLFHAAIESRTHPGRSVTVKLARRGVLRWRVQGVELPAPASSP